MIDRGKALLSLGMCSYQFKTHVKIHMSMLCVEFPQLFPPAWLMQVSKPMTDETEPTLSPAVVWTVEIGCVTLRVDL